MCISYLFIKKNQIEFEWIGTSRIIFNLYLILRGSFHILYIILKYLIEGILILSN